MKGMFVTAAVPFREGDGRYKIRPALVLAVKKCGEDEIFLLAPRYSSGVGRVDGEVEVAMDAEPSIGLDRPGVLRFGRGSLVVVTKKGIIRCLGHIDRLPPLKAEALRRAAKRIGCPI